jgi:hypothetical protein
MKKIRLLLILLIGGLLIYFAFQSQFKTFFFDSIIELGLILLGLSISIWTFVTDIKNYKANRRLKTFASTILCLTFAIIIAIFHIRTQINFNKPTLLKVFYDGDFNGTGIDFKTDGNYIFDNSDIGLSDYFYGSYKIADDRITMDKDQFDNLTNLKYLEIREKKNENNATDLYLYQIDTLGNLIDNSNEFRVTIDNRKNINKK